MGPVRFLLCSILVAVGTASAQPFLDPSLPLDTRVADLVSRLTLAEKTSLMSSTQPAIGRLGIAARNVGSEALHGVAYQTATMFPQAQGFGHTWDPDLIQAVGSAIGDEERIYNRRGMLSPALQVWSPVVDLARDPRWGRTEEVYGEDPYISAAIGGAYVRGIQGGDPRYYKTVPTLKHFAANSMEDNRTWGSSNVDPRNLHEYYLKPFEKITREAGVQSYMASYNAINDLPCSVTNLFRDVARAEWGFNGFVVSDAWDLTVLVTGHDYTNSMAQGAALMIRAGVDSISEDDAGQWIAAALSQGYLTEDDLDLALRRNFRVRFLTGEFDPPAMVSYTSIPDSALMSPAHAALARQVGRESVVLLKNNGNLLPLDSGAAGQVAVIGPRANQVLRDWYSGYPPYKVTAFDGITSRIGSRAVLDEGLTQIALRSRANNLLLTGAGLQNAPLTATSTSSSPGAQEWLWTEDLGWGCTTLRSTNGYYVDTDSSGNVVFGDSDPNAWNQSYCFTVQPLSGGDVALVYYDGSYVTADSSGGLSVAAANGSTAQRFQLTTISDGATRAATLAAQSDVAVVVVGSSPTINGKENHDRPDITLPPAQDQLIQAVSAVNPKTVVIVMAGYPMAITAPQQNSNVPAILYTTHGGQETGNFLADVLFGDYNPAGRLTMTWFQSIADLPPMADYDIRKGRTYWYFQGQPLYPFGYGLSYTTFDYRNLTIAPQTAGPNDTVQVSVDVVNTGARAGDEVVQLYTHALGSKVQRPIQELKHFARVTLNPGDTRTVSFSMPVSELSFWDVRSSQFVVEQGAVEIQVGASSRDIRLRGQVQVNGQVLPPRNGLGVIRAENYDDYAGVLLTLGGDGTQVVGYIYDGSWVSYHEVDFGAGVTRMEANVASAGIGGTIDVHLDSLNGPVAVTCTVPVTGDWYGWATIVCPGVQASGVHDVYLQFHGGAGAALFALKYFLFAADGSGLPAIGDGAAVDAAGFTEPLLRGSWASVFGTSLATTTRGWTLADFAGNAMPVSLDGTRVQVDGVDAPVWYISPAQVNFQVPEGVTLGAGVLQAFTPSGPSQPIAVTIGEAQPAFFFVALGGRNWLRAQHADYSPIGTPAPARPGETIVLWGSGFGQTAPPIAPGLLQAAPAPLADPAGVTVTIGGETAQVQYAGMTIAGVYQINVTVPADLADGIYEVAAMADGQPTTVTTVLPVQH
jgi:beta-glucosidase